jgi:hypothetical protein
MKPDSRNAPRIRLSACIGIALGVAALATGCGRDNWGEPRGPAKELSAPNLGDVHVYCVETRDVRVTPCTVDLAADAGHSRAELQRWWLRAARALRKAGTFHYKDRDWRFSEVFVDEPSFDGKLEVDYGWKCEIDRGHSPLYVARLMDDRNPGAPHGIRTLAAARKRGCNFAPYPELKG